MLRNKDLLHYGTIYSICYLSFCLIRFVQKREKMKDEMHDLNAELLEAQIEKTRAETESIQLNNEKSDTSES